MNRSERAAWVFAGDAPGVWWVVHAQSPRFAARLLSAEEFAGEPRYASLLPHGLNVPLPVHFNLGADVLVVTDFLDPVELDESDSPQQAILTGPMIEAMHACQQAIAEVAAGDPTFAPLADRAEQFLVGWRLQRQSDGSIDLQHASGAWVRAEFDADGDCETTLRIGPRDDSVAGWEPEVLRERLERVAGERALGVDGGWARMDAEGAGSLAVDVFSVLARQDRRRLSWVVCSRGGDAEAPRLSYVALRISGPVPMVCPTAVEIDARSPLHLGARPLSEPDVDGILALLPGYGLSAAVSMCAAHHFAWFEEALEDAGDRRRAAPLPNYPCEVEVVHGGSLLAAAIFAPADARGLFRLVVAPHAPANAGDTAALLPFECLILRREQFHLPRYFLSPPG